MPNDFENLKRIVESIAPFGPIGASQTTELLKRLDASRPFLEAATAEQFAQELTEQALDAVPILEWPRVIGAAVTALLEARVLEDAKRQAAGGS